MTAKAAVGSGFGGGRGIGHRISAILQAGDLALGHSDKIFPQEEVAFELVLPCNQRQQSDTAILISFEKHVKLT